MGPSLFIELIFWLSINILWSKRYGYNCFLFRLLSNEFRLRYTDEWTDECNSPSWFFFSLFSEHTNSHANCLELQQHISPLLDLFCLAMFGRCSNMNHLSLFDVEQNRTIDTFFGFRKRISCKRIYNAKATERRYKWAGWMVYNSTKYLVLEYMDKKKKKKNAEREKCGPQLQHFKFHAKLHRVFWCVR